MDWIACVGIDWGDKRHAYMIQTREGSKQAGWFGSSAEEVHEWARGLGERFPAGTIIVAVEQGRGSLLYALMAYEYLVLVPINPRASKAYRESLRLSGSSSDPTDAALIGDFAMKHLSELRVWKPDEVRTRKIRLLCEQRRSLVDQRTALTHALSAALKEYFPQVLQWFGEEKSPHLRAFLTHWATLEQARQASADDITNMLKANRRRKASTVAQALIEKIRVAVPLTRDTAVIEAQSMYARSLVALIDPSIRRSPSSTKQSQPSGRIIPIARSSTLCRAPEPRWLHGWPRPSGSIETVTRKLLRCSSTPALRQ